MAKRNSRKGKGTRKQPELRTGGGRAAKAERSRERRETVARTTEAGPAVRMRPAGPGGMALVLVLAWLGVAGVAIVGLVLDRWNVAGYPDSLWLYAAFGCAAVAPAVGRVARSVLDADAWGLQSLVVPTGLFVAETVVGPSCPIGAECGAVGARGSLGLLLSLLVIAALAFAAWALARWMYRAGSRRRPAQGRVRYRIAAVAILTLMVFPGTVVAAALVGADLLARDTPKLALEARQQVEEECYGLDDAPALVARAAPQGYNPDWTTFAVRRENEDRPGIARPAKGANDDAEPADVAAADDATAKDPDKDDAKAKDRDKAKAKPKPTTDDLPDDWTNLQFVHPYEATVSFNSAGEVVSVTCRRIGPGSGNAVADDLVQAEPDANPMSPKTTGAEFLPRFFTQGIAGPTEEAKKKASEEAAAKRREDAADAARPDDGDDEK